MENIVTLIKNMIRENMNYTEKYNNDFFKNHQKAQHPIITCITCSDSRVQSEIFSHNAIDNVFTIRNIGNQVLNNIGSVDYGVIHLHTPVLLILGHTDCGAIKAFSKDYSNETKEIIQELDSLKKCNCQSCETLEEKIVQNINYQVAYCVDRYKELVANGKLIVLGAVYDFHKKFSDVEGSMLICNINGLMGKEELEELNFFDTIINDNLFI